MCIPAGEVAMVMPSGEDVVQFLLLDPAVIESLDTIMQSRGEVPSVEQILVDRTHSPKKKKKAEAEIPLTPSRLEGIGKEKVDKLIQAGIRTVEALAAVTVDSRDVASVDAAIRITKNRRGDGAVRTLAGWRAKAVDYLDRRRRAS